MSNIDRIRSACAKVVIGERQRGTAFLITSQLVITAAHVIDDKTTAEIQFQHQQCTADVIAVDKARDCAILQTRQPVEDVAPIQYRFDAAMGEDCQIVGYPGFLGGAVTLEGRVQDVNARLQISENPVLLLSVSHPLSAEESGGVSGSPVISNGVVVGIFAAGFRTSRQTPTGFFAAIPIQDALSLLPTETIEALRKRESQEQKPDEDEKPEIVVISALDEELDYLYELPLQWSGPIIADDGLTYRRGKLLDGLTIVATTSRAMGLTATAITAAKALKEWRPRLVAMIGICGGRKAKEVNIGDIIVASQSFHYQFGAFKDGKIERELHVENTDGQLLALVEHFTRRTPMLSGIQNSVPRGFKSPKTTLNCHIGPIASADLVVKDVKKLGEAVEAERKTIGIDMETYAFMRAARLAGTRMTLATKAVTDFADAKKDDEYREYAKYAVANFFVTLVKDLASGWT